MSSTTAPPDVITGTLRTLTFHPQRLQTHPDNPSSLFAPFWFSLPADPFAQLMRELHCQLFALTLRDALPCNAHAKDAPPLPKLTDRNGAQHATNATAIPAFWRLVIPLH